MRRRCEKEVMAMSRVVFWKAAKAVEGWKERKEAGEGKGIVDRVAYTEVSQVVQFVSGVQEAAFMLIDSKRKCRMCGGGECQCELVLGRRGSVTRVGPLDKRIEKAKRVLEEELPARGRMMEKGDLWAEYHKLNKLKSLLVVLRAQWGGVKWEKEWAKMIQDEWKDGKNKAESEGWTRDDVVYLATVTFSRMMYVGETGGGLMKRMISHIRRAVGGKTRQKIYKIMAATGVHKFAWIPIWAWSGAKKITRRMRMKKEGECIWCLDPKMNTLGTMRPGERQGANGFTIVGKRKRFRLATRLTRLQKRGVMVDDEKKEQMVEMKKEERGKERKRRGRLMAMVAWLARRPWKEAEILEAKNGTMKEVKKIKQEEVRKLLKVVDTTLDQTSRSIANANLKMLWKKREDIAVVNVKLNSVMFNKKGAKEGILEGLRRWSWRWRRTAGKVVVMRVTIAPTSTRSILDILGPTSTWGKKDRAEMRCCCRSKECEGLDKWRGHVFQDLNEYLDSVGLRRPGSWTLKSRCAAMPEVEQRKLEDEMLKLAERVEKKVSWEGQAVARPMMPAKLQRKLRLEMEAREMEIPSEREVMKLKKSMDHLVVAPVDKDPGSAMMICPKCWLDSIDEFTKDMQKLSKEEEGQRRVWVATAGQKLEHLPHTGLGRMKAHKFGVLRTWPKYKKVKRVRKVMRELKKGKKLEELDEEDLEVWIQGWSELRWRPLVSHAGHRWKGVYRLLGQMCNALVRELKLGSEENSGRGMLERIHEFNDGARVLGSVPARRKKQKEEKRRRRRRGARKGGRAGKGKGKGKGKVPELRGEEEDRRGSSVLKVRRLRRKILDINNFFISVPREKLVERVKVLIEKVRKRSPGARYFSVEKVQRFSADAEVPRDVLRQGGWRKPRPGAKQRQGFTESLRRGWASICLDDVEELFSWRRSFSLLQEQTPIREK